jgi:hypothetical protein
MLCAPACGLLTCISGKLAVLTVRSLQRARDDCAVAPVGLPNQDFILDWVRHSGAPSKGLFRMGDSRSIWSPDTGSARQTGIRLIDASSSELRWSRLFPLVFAGDLIVATAAWFIVGWLMN